MRRVSCAASCRRSASLISRALVLALHFAARLHDLPDPAAAMRAFFCRRIVDADAGPERQPLTCKMVVYFEPAARRLSIRVVPERPDAWRKEPYCGQIKQWARAAVQARQLVVLYIRRRMIMILPDKETHLRR